MRSYSSVKAIQGLVYLELSIHPRVWGFIKFAFQNKVSEVFNKAVEEIFQNNYLKANFENPEISDFVVTFWNFLRGKFS